MACSRRDQAETSVLFERIAERKSLAITSDTMINAHPRRST